MAWPGEPPYRAPSGLKEIFGASRSRGCAPAYRITPLRGLPPTLGPGSLPPAHHVCQQIDAAVRVAPLVVVPADQLEEAIIQLDAGAGVEDARMGVVNEIAGNDLVAGVGQD